MIPGVSYFGLELLSKPRASGDDPCYFGGPARAVL